MLSVLLTGCADRDRDMEEALALRSKLLGAQEVSFTAQICADYTDRKEWFALSCRIDSAGALTFRVESPDEISGITGGVSGERGTLTFDDTILAFPMLAQERLSPVSGPWVMMQAMRTGYLSACVREGELLRVTVDDRYGDDPLTVDLWIRAGEIVAAEIGWRGIRQMTMELESFSVR